MAQKRVHGHKDVGHKVHPVTARRTSPLLFSGELVREELGITNEEKNYSLKSRHGQNVDFLGFLGKMDSKN